MANDENFERGQNPSAVRGYHHARSMSYDEAWGELEKKCEILIALPVHLEDQTFQCKVMINHKTNEIVIGSKQLPPLSIPLARLGIEEFNRMEFCDHMDKILLVHLHLQDGKLVFEKKG